MYVYKLFDFLFLHIFLFLDLSDIISDDDEKENLSPDDMPSTVVIDAFGGSFEEAVSLILSSYNVLQA